MSTDDPVPVFDWRRWEIMDEVLLSRGAELPDQVVLLENHRRYELSDVLGSVRDLRTEGQQTVGRLYFDEDERAERAWGKVKRRHVRDVSVGYRALEYIDIEPGHQKTIGGTTYTARERVLRVTTRWELRELSVTPIGADRKAKTRNLPNRSESMNPRLRTYLESIGMRSEATEEQAREFLALLSGRKAQIANVLETETQSETAAFAARAALKELGIDPDDPTKPLAGRIVGHLRLGPDDADDADDADDNLPVNVDAVRAEATEAERQRVSAIRSMAPEGIDERLVQRAIDDGWDEARGGREFLAALRDTRTESVGSGPAGHSHSRDLDCTREALGAALMIREGLDPVAQYARFQDGAFVPWREGESRAALEQAADRGYRYRDMSLIDFCREAIRLDGGRMPSNRGEIIRAAVSGSTLTNIFTTSVSAQLLSGYQDAADSTAGWTSSSDVLNFQTNERIAMGKFGALKRLARGKTAEHLDESDEKEEYRIARYAGQFVVDEQDIIDDRLGAVSQVAPSDMGSSAAQLRPNLVYAILLANAAMADTGALFNNTAETTAGGHANLTTDALDAPGLEAGLVAMAKHRIRNRPINIKARYLLVPQDLRFTAAVLLKSATRDYDATDGIYNPLAYEGIELRMDDRIGVAGVTDPATETEYAGTATNWFLAGRPGENGAKTIEVGYLRGTGRAPQLRSFVLTQGQYGVGWDINLDIGAKAIDWRALHKSTGAA